MDDNHTPQTLLRLPQVLKLLPISRSAGWKGCKEGRYPKPIKLGPRTTVWREADIASFIEEIGQKNDTSGEN